MSDFFSVQSSALWRWLSQTWIHTEWLHHYEWVHTWSVGSFIHMIESIVKPGGSRSYQFYHHLAPVTPYTPKRNDCSSVYIWTLSGHTLCRTFSFTYPCVLFPSDNDYVQQIINVINNHILILCLTFFFSSVNMFVNLKLLFFKLILLKVVISNNSSTYIYCTYIYIQIHK